MAKKYTTLANKVIYIKIVSDKNKLKNLKNKKEKQTPSAEAVRRYNERIAEKNLSMILNWNFKPYDIFATLTYANAPTPEESKKLFRNFRDRFKRYCEKNDIEYKWVVCTEYENTRIHHHIVLPKMPYEDLAKIWKYGNIKVTPLYEDGDYRPLAHYMIKETKNSFNAPDSVYKQRYSCSGKIKMPETREIPASEKTLTREPKSIKGYHIDKDSIIQGRNPVTGIPYLEYVLVSDTPIPRYKKWTKGKKVKTKERTYEKLYEQLVERQTEINLNDLTY